MQHNAAPYDPEAYPAVAVTVDLVLMTIADGQLSILLQRRKQEPFSGYLSLPGSFVRPDEDLDLAARRILAEKTDLSDIWLEQLYSFGDPGRDPRMRIISVAYFALIPAGHLMTAVAGRDELILAPEYSWQLPLAFDHATIIGVARERLRGKLGHSPIALALLPELFTLRDLQAVHETILGGSLNKPAFRRRMLDSGWIEGTGDREAASAFRPAELFRRSNAGHG